MQVAGSCAPVGLATLPTDGKLAREHRNKLLAKRTMDIVVAGLVLPLAFPLMLVIALAVRLSSKGPVLLQQERIGRYGRPFILIKFRTMVWPGETALPQLATPNDPRITSIGLILRRWRLDELPQLWLVLKGEMSLVGPRPERAYFLQQIIARLPQYPALFSLRPGLVSLGWVRQGYAHNLTQLVLRARHDLLYLAYAGLWQDLKIIMAAVKIILMANLRRKT